MLSFRQFLRETRLVHGTLVDHEKSIRQRGLEPGTSDYTKSFYDDPSPTVYMARDKDVKRSVSSIRGQIGKKLNKHPKDVSHDDIENHGMLVTTRIHDPYSTRKLKDDGSTEYMQGHPGNDDRPEQTEPGDYFSHETHHITGVLKGRRLVHYLKKNKHI